MDNSETWAHELSHFLPLLKQMQQQSAAIWSHVADDSICSSCQHYITIGIVLSLINRSLTFITLASEYIVSRFHNFLWNSRQWWWLKKKALSLGWPLNRRHCSGENGIPFHYTNMWARYVRITCNEWYMFMLYGTMTRCDGWIKQNTHSQLTCELYQHRLA